MCGTFQSNARKEGQAMSGLPLVPTRVSKRSFMARNAGEGSLEAGRRIQCVPLPAWHVGDWQNETCMD